MLGCPSYNHPPPAGGPQNYSHISGAGLKEEVLRIADSYALIQVNIPARSAQLTVYGYTADTTSYAGNKATITYNQNAAAAGSNDASGTVRVQATNLKMYNVNVKNTCKSFQRCCIHLFTSARISCLRDILPASLNALLHDADFFL